MDWRELTGGHAAILLTFAVAVLSVVTGIANIGAPSVPFEPLRAYVPAFVRTTAGFTGTLTGFLMLVSAFGLRRGLRAAWTSTMVLLPLTATQGLLQSNELSFPLVGLSAVNLLVLVVNRRRFDRELDVTATQLAAVLAIGGAQVYGTAGAYALRDQFSGMDSLVDAFYFALVTGSTVGYGDITPQTDFARLFGMSALLVTVSSFAVALGVLLTPAIEARLSKALGRMTETQLDLLENHVLVLGYGDLTEPIVEELLDARTEFVVVTESDQRARYQAIAPAVEAQTRGKIAGSVVDADTGDPLPGVNVVIAGTTLGTVTDADGDYFIANLEPGTYDVRASFVGYSPVTVQGVEVGTDRTARVDFRLEEETVVGEEVVVVAERPLVERDNTTSVVRLESQEVTTRPTTELTDVLNTLPSINEEGGQMTVRGGTLDEVAFRVDGARARNPLNHDPYTRINLGAIEELEVITGSFNAEYGEAQSGVINVVTKEGKENYEFYIDGRYEPAGLNHWGTSLYDRSSDLFWENTHARHLEWWIEYPDMWVDPNGVRGSDPRSIWTPEEAYENYLETHQPLTDYTDIPTYQTEVGLGGPVPLIDDLYFFGTLKRRSEAPLLGNAYRDRGLFTDGTLKLTYRIGGGKKLMLSGFYGRKAAGWGFAGDDDYSVGGYPFWAEAFGVDSRYAYYDLAGYPTSSTNGQTLQFSHVVNASTLWELKLVRVQALRELGTFPADSIGFSASDAARDQLRAVTPSGNPIPGGNANRIGYHTSGYLFRYDDDNTEWQLEGYLSSQLNKYLHLKTGVDFSYYQLDHFNQTKFPNPGATDDRLYDPYQGAVYGQGKLELGGLILNAGLGYKFMQQDAVEVKLVVGDIFNQETGISRSITEMYVEDSRTQVLGRYVLLNLSYRFRNFGI